MCVPPAHYRTGGVCQGGLPNTDPPPDRDPPWTETPPDRDPHGQTPLDIDPPWTETPLDRDPTDRDPPDRDPPGHVTCGACWDRDSPCGQK